MVWAYMGPREKMPEPPATEVFHAPPSHRVIRKIVVDGNWLQMMEGDIDSSHVAFLHSSLEAVPQSISRQVNPAAYQDKAPRWTIKPTDYGVMLAAQRNAGPDHYHWRINQWLMPFATLVAAPVETPFITNIRIPIDDEHTMQFRVWTHPDRQITEEEHRRVENGILFPDLIPGTFTPVANASNDYLIDREDQKRRTYTGIKAVPVQDLAVTQDTGTGPIADRGLEKLTSSDLAIVTMRKRLLDSVKALMAGQEPPEANNMRAYRVRPIDTILPRDVDVEEGTRAVTMRAAE
jgi:hypothetical protein